MKKRASDLLQEISEADPREVHDADFLTLKRYSIEGMVKLESLSFCSGTLGEFTIPLGKVEWIHVFGMHDTSLVLDAAQFAADGNTWISTGVTVNSGESLQIKASGTVDIWPQAPGQYVAASPKGYNTAGKGGHNAAALVGRIGRDGQTFVIGDGTTIQSRDVGTLFVQIVASPWNNISSGQCQVTVKSGR